MQPGNVDQPTEFCGFPALNEGLPSCKRCQTVMLFVGRGNLKIRPHRFGGEGVLIGGQSATLNAQ